MVSLRDWDWKVCRRDWDWKVCLRDSDWKVSLWDWDWKVSLRDWDCKVSLWDWKTQSPDVPLVGGELTQTVTGSKMGDCVPAVSSKHAAGDDLSPDKLQEVESLSPHGLTQSDSGEHVFSPLVVLEKLSEEFVRCSQESSITISPEKGLSLSSQSIVRSVKLQSNYSPNINVSPCRCVEKFKGFKELSPREVEKDVHVAASQHNDQKSLSTTQPALDQERTAQHCSPEAKSFEMREQRDCSGSHHSEIENIPLALPAVNDWRRGELQVSDRLCFQTQCPGSAPSKSSSLRGNLTNTAGLVHYFWGIPFCPSNLDPDEYTSVILCQLETYEKCLKQAQSQLLRKLEFGLPVLPAPVPREIERLRRGQHAPEEPITMPNPELDIQKEQESQGEQNPQEQLADDDQSTEDAQISSDQMERKDGNSQEKSADMFVEETPEEDVNGRSCPSGGVESKDSRNVASCVGGIHSEDDVLFVCADTQYSCSEGVQPESKNPQPSEMVTAQEPEDVVLIDDDSEEFRPVISKKACVECPLCGQRFSLEKIEVHAADCNGDRDGDWQARTRNKRRAGKQNGADGHRTSMFTQ
ncbi:BRCA1-A complex subunit RAP80 [Scyliorhinus canicula]|uniref:BRCA1-A complex subunit RAP80 n=1 Tax=Scyliorhinus canicula TaxID=7830 RepID=UPI0018F6B11C|nr:BRCA1-A complex subunit RAP80 [Scyliorhinus canicula]